MICGRPFARMHRRKSLIVVTPQPPRRRCLAGARRTTLDRIIRVILSCRSDAWPMMVPGKARIPRLFSTACPRDESARHKVCRSEEFASHRLAGWPRSQWKAGSAQVRREILTVKGVTRVAERS